MFSIYTQDNTTQIFSLKLCQPYRKNLKGQKGLSYLGPSLSNKIDTECKLIANLNTFIIRNQAVNRQALEDMKRSHVVSKSNVSKKIA